MRLLLVAAFLALALVACRPRNGGDGSSEGKAVTAIPGDFYRLRLAEVRQLERSALAGDAQAAVRLSDHYTFAVKDEDLGFRWLEVAAKNGDAKSQYNWGFILRMHHKDEEAAKWFRAAIETSERVNDVSTRDASVEALHEIEGRR